MNFSYKQMLCFAFVMFALSGLAAANIYNVTINVPTNNTVFSGRLTPTPSGMSQFDLVDKRISLFVNWTPWGDGAMNLTNATLWANFTGTWMINKTNNTLLGNVANQSLGNFSYIDGIAEGSYTLAINATNVTGPSLFSANTTIVVDMSVPFYNFLTGGTNNTNTSFNYFFVNLTVNDTLSSISSCLFTNQTTGVNNTLTQNLASKNTSCSVNYTSLPDGIYNVTGNFNDSGNNFNNTITVFYRVDATSPTQATPTNPTLTNANTSLSYVFANYTFVESNFANCTLQFNHNNGTTYNYSMTKFINSTGGYCEYNATNAHGFSNLPSNYTVWVMDGASVITPSSLNRLLFDNVTPAGINAVSPTLANNSNTSTDWVFLNFTFVELAPFNCTAQVGLATGATSNFSMTMQQNSTGGYCWANLTSIASGQYNATFWINDTTGNINSTGPFFIRVDTLKPAALSLLTPINNSYTTYNYAFVNFTFVESNPLGCILQYGNATGTTNFTMNAFNNATGGYCSYNVTGNFTVAANQTHNFTFWVNDSVGNINTTGMLFITHDSVAPTGLSLRYPANASYTSYNYTFVNFTFLDLNPNNCILEFGNATQVANYSMNKFANSTGGYCSFNVTGNFTVAANQTHNYTIWINDSAGNLNSSGAFFIIHDSATPSGLSLRSPSNNSYTTYNYTFVNFTFLDLNPNNCILEFGNATQVANYSMNKFANSTGGYCSFNVTGNFTVAAMQAHNFTFWVNDSAGNLNSSGLYFVTHDSVLPTSINNASPTVGNDSFTRNDWVYVNYTLVDQTPANCTIVFNHGNGTTYNYSMQLNDTSGTDFCYRNVTNAFTVTNQEANYTVWVTDLASNANFSSLRYVGFDNVTPNVLTLVSPTLANNSNTTNPNNYVNITFTESNLASCTLNMYTPFNGGTGANFSMSEVGETNCYFDVTGYAIDALRNYTVWVTDESGNYNSTGIYFVRVDATVPSAVTIASPTRVNQSNTSVNWLFVNFTFTETNPANCTLQFRHANNTQYNYTMTANQTGATTGFCYRNMTGLASGIANYTVWVMDSLSQTNSTFAGLMNVRVDTTTANQLSFAAANFYNTSQRDVFVNVSFNATSPANCTLQFDNRSGNYNYSMTLVGSGSSAYCYFNVTGNFTVTGQEANFTTWIRTGASVYNASDLQTVRFDNGTPTVTLTSPGDAATLTTSPTFAYTYSDALTFGRCSLYIDSVLINTASGVTGVNSSAPAGITTATPHTWLISCIDDAGNMGNSSSRTFNIAPSSGGSTSTATPVPTAAPAPAATPDTSRSVPPIGGGGITEPAAPVEETQSLGSSSEVSGTFSDTSSSFTLTYTAPSGGFTGDITYRLPLDYADYEAGLVTISPEPKSVAPGSVIATWDVALAPEEQFAATVEVAKQIDSAVLTEFKAPSLAAKQVAVTARPTTAASATPKASATPTPAQADNTLWYAVGAILLLGVLYYVFMGGKSKHKGL